MENATQALYMAFAVLIFVLALTISISLFTQARATAEVLISYTDDTQYIVVDDTADTSRKVGAETIIPSLYRVFKENYIVRFLDADGTPLYIFSIYNGNSSTDTNVIDMSSTNSSIDTEANSFRLRNR